MSDSEHPWLSVIIPTLNERENLPRCVAALVKELPESQMEIIVADGGSTDGTAEYAAGHPRLKTLPCTRGRARQMNAGASVARGTHLWFLHADTLPPLNWEQHLLAARAGDFSACFSLRFTGQERSAALRFYARGSRWPFWWLRFGDQSLFVSRRRFDQVGGYRENHQLMEGHEIVSRLRRSGNFRVLPAAVTTSARRYDRFGVIRTQAFFTLIFALFHLGIPQSALVCVYRYGFPAEAVAATSPRSKALL